MDPSKPLANSRHEAFALAWAKDKSAAEALRAAGYADQPANAKRMTNNDQIKARKEWLQRQTATKMTMDEAEKREILAGIARSSDERATDRIAAIRADNDLAGDGSEAKANEGVRSILDAVRAITHGA